MISKDDAETLGALITSEVKRQVAEAVERVVMGREARVATEAVIGEPALTTTTSTNGGTIQLAKVWLDVETPAADNWVTCPVWRAVTGLAEGDYVLVWRKSPGSNQWEVVAKR